MVSDEEFEAELVFRELKEKYNSGLRQNRSQLTAEYERDRDELRRLKIAAVESERVHRDLLNLCVFPFTENQPGCSKLGYRFLRGSPLSEEGLPNFDFLIARLTPEAKPAIVIAGEAKGSVGSPDQVVHEVAEKRRILLEHSGVVLERYLGQPRDRRFILEVVIAVDSVDAGNVMAAVVESGEDFKVWHGPVAGPEILSLMVPPAGTPQSRKFVEPERSKYLHAEPELDSLLDKLPSLRRCFSVWPSTHVLIQLEALIAAAHPGGNGMLVTSRDVEGVLRHDMFYLSDEERLQQSRKILELGQGIGFLAPSTVADEFRIVSRAMRRDLLEQTLTDKWVKWQIQRDFESDLEVRRASLQAELRRERGKVKPLF